MWNCKSIDPVIFIVGNNRLLQDTTHELLTDVGIRALEFDHPSELLEAAKSLRPDCILIICQEFTEKEIEWFDQINNNRGNASLIIIAVHASIKFAVASMQSGATDFFVIPFRKESLLNSVNSAVVNSRIQAELIANDNAVKERLKSLTSRETEILELVGEGLSTKQIASKLHISSSTVDVHRSHLMRQLEIESLEEWMDVLVVHFNLKLKRDETSLIGTNDGEERLA